MGVVINFILHCYRRDTNKMCVGFPRCLRASLAFATATKLVSLCPKFTFKGTSPPTTCARIDRPVNALQLCAESFQIKKFVADFLRKKPTFIRKTANLRFEPLKGLRGSVRRSS